MQLIDTRNSFVYAEIKVSQGKEIVCLYEPLAKKNLLVGGITVPEYLEEKFGYQKKITADNQDFTRAFKEIVADRLIKSGHYIWHKK